MHSRAWNRLVGIVLVLALLTAPALALAAERITRFTDAVILSTDGSVDVTETIEVEAEGRQIRHGIFRDIPTVLVNPDNTRLRSRLDVIAVTRDGRPEPYSTEGITNGVRIRIGSADTELVPGRHRYVIHYTMTRMARHFADHDELYWNATGNYWDFPIATASAAVTLPKGAVISSLTAYTGQAGSREHAATAEKTADNVAVFRTTRTLAPGEGLTVAVAFQKGVLTAPGPLLQAQYWLSDHRDLIVPGIGVLVVLLYNLLAWDAVGRDPRRGTIIPRFHPPQGVSPALVHYVRNFGWKKSGWTAFTAAIFDLGVRGAVTVDNSFDVLKVSSTGKTTPDLPEEEAVLEAYFRANGVVEVDKTNGPDLDRKRREVLSSVKDRAGNRYFVRNYLYSGIGLALALGVLVAMVGFGVLDPAMLIVTGVASVIVFALANAFGAFGGGRPFSRIALIIWVVVAGVNAIGSISAALAVIHIDPPVIAALSIVLVTAVFGWLMRAATPEGRTIMDEIDGFRMYLDTAEKNRLNFRDEPPMSVERFESILPFAIALGVEKPWSERFEADLARNAVAGATAGTYHPVWYSGTRSFDSRNLSRNVAAVATGMSAAMIAAQPARSSSSGFGGGGGSGGGGGGGGGGGW